MWKQGSVCLVSICRKTSLQIQSHFWEEFDLVSYLLRYHSWQLNQSLLRHPHRTPWPRRRLAITLLPLLPRFPPNLRSTLEERISRSRWVSLRWCRPALSVARTTRMLALISNNSWSSAALLLSREHLRMRFGSDYFYSLFWGEQSSGSILTKAL